MTETCPMTEMIDALDGPSHTSAVCRKLKLSPHARQSVFAGLRSVVVTDFEECPRYKAVHNALPEDRAAKLDGLAAKLGLSYLDHLNPHHDARADDLRSAALTDMQELYQMVSAQKGVSQANAQELVHEVLASTAYHLFSAIQTASPAPHHAR